MAKILWDQVGEKLYETGVKNAVLYPISSGTYPNGYAWNGITDLNEKPSGAESKKIYADDGVYLNLMSNEEYKATISAFTYPDEFAECDGTSEVGEGVTIGQQNRKTFGLAYKTTIGNDVDGVSHGYKLHLVYGLLASPSEKAYKTINDSPEAMGFSWDATSTPVAVTGKKPTSTLVIDSSKVDPDVLAIIEDILFGTAEADARLPLPDEIIDLLSAGVPSALSLSTISPADDATDIVVGANIVMTFNNKIQKENIIVSSAAGAIVAGTKTWNTAGKVLTFNPTSDLAAGTTYIVTLGGVIDIYNQSLTAAVKNFTTAS